VTRCPRCNCRRSRHTLALYCGASGDHNPIHVDSDFARSAGMPTCSRTACCRRLAGALLTDWVPQSAIRSLDLRFAAITQVGDASPAPAG
jgi:acyl dehydratase